ncbi:uncharacterized protein THITE_2088791 [Thermothielavioides terrestris NRRL 8126]|uniref:Uncharacterized protein n=1 Tax=Thermothielavioides terrestris (strain ATCC 38088 / NRRL 8126) TaxID=578455 RepID=G2R0N9_THETT|nr:uncharacterized protein THITE_2088791 [Thermothielavioides terrestris NRRL 8126]AEO67300.1 hypothetical protein THITE_2088791 [Thermothielavioides terrestris NRRL 8126]
MCTTYTTYYSCGHLRNQRLIRCARRHEHLLTTVRNTDYTLDCRSCAQQRRRRRWWHDASDDGSVDLNLDLNLDVDVGRRDDRDYYDYEYECYERSYRHYPWREREWRRWLLMLD